MSELFGPGRFELHQLLVAHIEQLFVTQADLVARLSSCLDARLFCAHGSEAYQANAFKIKGSLEEINAVGNDINCLQARVKGVVMPEWLHGPDKTELNYLLNDMAEEVCRE